MTETRRWNEADLDQLFHEYRRTGVRATRNRLVEAHRGLAASIAHDYRDRGVELDDLVQIAMLGTLKAVERYEPERGIPFSSFASRTINGEIKRYFRDRTWAVRPPRSAQERHLDLRRTTAALTLRLGRAPKVTELAEELGITTDEVLEAMEAGAAYRATSLDARRPGDEEGLTLGDRLPSEEAASRPA
jgi:RNA polymerase sigma-B factor